MSRLTDSLPSGPVRALAPVQGRGTLVVATVGTQTPRLSGIDWIRIDGASGTLQAMAGQRAHHESPVLFDVPGPRTRRTGSLLTTSEFLVFAAAEGFEWVNLRGVEHPEDVLRAREFLPTSTRVSVTLSAPHLLRHAIEPLAEVVDALLLSRAEPRRRLGAMAAQELIRGAILTAERANAPTLLTDGVLPSILRRRQPRARDLIELEELISCGARGLVLTRETTDAEDPQNCIDVTRLLAEHADRDRVVLPSSRPSARVAGRMSVVARSASIDEVTSTH